jgi:type II secretory pathway pseudopilin PulG
MQYRVSPTSLGFSLVEILVTLLVTGIVAGLSITSMLNANTKVTQFDSIVKDTALILSSAFLAYEKNGITPLPGTITVTNAGSTVTGSGTTFMTDFVVGDQLLTGGSVVQSISAVTSNTSMTINATWPATETATRYNRIRYVNPNTRLTDFIEPLLALNTDTTTNASTVPAGEHALTSCAVNPCLVLRNGALLQYSQTNTFGSKTASNYITVALDPDGAGTQAGKINLLLYTTGQVISGSNAYGSTGTGALGITPDPAWFKGLGG